MKLVLFPHETLLTKARELSMEECLSWRLSDGTSIDSIVAGMTKIMRDNNGCGLAAPQVGLGIRLFITQPELDKEVFVFVNPKFESSSEEKELAIEGCLSLPGISANIARSKDIEVSYTRRPESEPISATVKMTGFPARIFQHEFDHLEGIMFIQTLDEADYSRILSHINTLQNP